MFTCCVGRMARSYSKFQGMTCLPACEPTWSWKKDKRKQQKNGCQTGVMLWNLIGYVYIHTYGQKSLNENNDVGASAKEFLEFLMFLLNWRISECSNWTPLIWQHFSSFRQVIKTLNLPCTWNSCYCLLFRQQQHNEDIYSVFFSYSLLKI